MTTFLPDLIRALIRTAVAFGPLLGVLLFLSWRALVAGVLVIAAWFVFVLAALSAGGQAWNPGGHGKATVIVGTTIAALLGLAALWLVRSGPRSDTDAPLSSRIARRVHAVLLGLAAVTWAIARYDTVPGAWYAVAHPRSLAEQRAVEQGIAEARRRLAQEARARAARQASARADSIGVARADSARAAQAARAAKPSVVPPLVLFDSAGNAHTILVDERTDVIALDPVRGGTRDSIPDPSELMNLLEDRRMAPRVRGRRVILAIERRYGTRWFSPRRGQEVMFRDDSASLTIRRAQLFYDPRTGAFSMDAYEWMLYVLGMDPLEAWSPYRNNMRRFPPAGSPMPYGDEDVVHRR